MFEKDGQHLTVINVNRHPLEKTLGVDLIYYARKYQSYILVQYKALRSEPGGWVYRPSNDRSIVDEVDRMQSVGASNWDGVTKNYRLGSGSCFFKFCPKKTEDPYSNDMLPGYYVPLDFWMALNKSGELTGPRGGAVVSPETLGRYFTNTDFIALVEDGWIGSTGHTSSHLNEIVESVLESGKSVILAVH